LLLTSDRPSRTFARARICMGPLSPHRQPLAVTQAAVATQIHQPLDVHCDHTAQVAFDRILAIDQFANPQYLVVGHVADPPFGPDADASTDFLCLGVANPVNIGQPNRHSLLVRNIDASNSRHGRISLNIGERANSPFVSRSLYTPEYACVNARNRSLCPRQ